MLTLKVGHICSSFYTFLTNAVSWACFKIKTVNSPTKYHWQQPCIYVEWDCKTGRQLVFIFSLRDSWVSSFVDHIPDHEKRTVNPFAWHHAFAKEVLQIYDSAHWKLRDIVRAEEKAWHYHGILLPQRNRDELQNKADGRLPHDISRHLYHYQETIEVADNTLQALLTAQERWRQESPRQVLHVLPSWLDTYSGLLFEKNRVFSLICRIKGLNDRHINEINLSFNLISERSSRASSSGNPMKAVLTLCLVYLPGIFVSTLFSTSFFSNQSDIFTISSSFWVYWVIAIPLTLVTFLLWATANPANVLRNIAGVKGTVQTQDSPTVLDREKQAISKLQTPLKGLGWRRSAVGGHEPV
ncbi:hypothetical protein ASPVEDRAFT_144440 [Aspergillus versicolor CBS 583.65]|uniref:Uncharacterized protein n=1 Tax=Aspergillus versicolor CBS 583.65 TaxID=1036611 RepID=A0A1L9Q462_ASPVE|nr:uncharacterized protein ASPVEDRAFT_144440 [Aspergillus versicolor CBS 583.65]OJJ08554.1 hypothetical protein ASPVEDRAFT_144440 [Aspergillus versicolor CBS 583.65]